MDRCPKCNSSAPHMHPAVQHEGEVVLCVDAFHLRPTPQNRPEYIAAVDRKRRARPFDPLNDYPDHGLQDR